MKRVFNQVGFTMHLVGSAKPSQQLKAEIFQGKQPHWQ